jgi:hypothetical protein
MARGKERRIYTPTYEETQTRAERRGSMFDNMFKDAKMFRAKQGPNILRILPPGWLDDPRFKNVKPGNGLRVMIHRNVGPNDRSYLCNRENVTSPYKSCPMCDELYALGSRATREDKRELLPTESVAFYVIDREAENEGVQVWVASAALDSELASQCLESRSKKVINIHHPDDGYDIEFTRTGEGMKNTRYRGMKVQRESRPLADSDRRYNDWMDIAFDTPLPDILQFYSPEHLEKVLFGKAQDEEEEKPVRNTRNERGRFRDDDDEEVIEEDRPSPRRRPRDEEEEEIERGDVQSRRSSRDEEGEDRPSSVRDRERARPSDEAPPRRQRERLGKELDDEIPSDGGRRSEPSRRGRGEDEDQQSEHPRDRVAPRRSAADDDEPSSRTRSSRDNEDRAETRRSGPTRSRDNDEEEETPRHRARVAEGGVDVDEEVRAEARRRLNRSRRGEG